MTKAQLVHLGGAAAIVAALLRAVGSFAAYAPPSAPVVGLYLTTDVFILLGLMGWYVAQHECLGWWGLAGFVLGVVGVALIRSSGTIPGIDTYSVGAPLLLLGLIALASRAWREGLMRAWVPGALAISAVLGPIGYLVPDLSPLFAASGLAFSVGIAGVGIALWRTR